MDDSTKVIPVTALAGPDRRGPNRRPAANRPPVPADIVVDSAAFQRLQKRIAAATILIPLVFSVAAVVLLFYVPITGLDLLLLLVMYPSFLSHEQTRNFTKNNFVIFIVSNKSVFICVHLWLISFRVRFVFVRG